ncbi:hypothetical protein EJ110_NYTH47639 [Nymphaea thermarum]|nr:hypothetical protein EJ110_NYTH47639 [Nymphaea thermarum]
MMDDINKEMKLAIQTVIPHLAYHLASSQLPLPSSARGEGMYPCVVGYMPLDTCLILMLGKVRTENVPNEYHADIGIIALVDVEERRLTTWGRTPFRHFQYWQELAGYRDQVDSAWAVDLRGCAMIKLIHKLEAIRDQLKSWCKGGANNLPHLIGEIKSKIRLRQTLSERGQNEAIEQECSLKRELTKLLILEERLWRQKARIKWMREGDLNTKFFQACTDYFIALLGTSHGDGSLPQSLAMGPKVTSEENADLLKSLSAAEIKWAVMKADKDSAPGPDGFGNSFFQSNWSTVHEAVAGAIRGFFQSGRLVKSINKTHITLLPKERGATQETLEANGEHIRAFLDSLNVQVSWPRVQAEQMDVLAWKNAGNSDISWYEIWQRTRKKRNELHDNMLVWKGRQLPRAVWVVYLGSAGRLPSDELVKTKGSHLASRCYICKHASEDIQHLFFDCKGAKLIWAHIYGKFGRTAPWHGSPPNIKIGLNRWHTQGFKDKSLTNVGKTASTLRYGSYGKRVTTSSTEGIFRQVKWLISFGRIAASTGGPTSGRIHN